MAPEQLVKAYDTPISGEAQLDPVATAALEAKLAASRAASTSRAASMSAQPRPNAPEAPVIAKTTMKLSKKSLRVLRSIDQPCGTSGPSTGGPVPLLPGVWSGRSAHARRRALVPAL